MKKLEKVRLKRDFDEALCLEDGMNEGKETAVENCETEEKWYKKYFPKGKIDFKIKPFPWKSLNLKNAIMNLYLKLLEMVFYIIWFELCLEQS